MMMIIVMKNASVLTCAASTWYRQTSIHYYSSANASASFLLHRLRNRCPYLFAYFDGVHLLLHLGAVNQLRTKNLAQEGNVLAVMGSDEKVHTVLPMWLMALPRTVNIIGRPGTPVRQAFSYGIRHVFIVNQCYFNHYISGFQWLLRCLLLFVFVCFSVFCLFVCLCVFSALVFLVRDYISNILKPGFDN